MRGAVVEARIAADGSMLIAATVAGPDGKYSLPGVPGVIYVQVIQHLYFDVNERVELTADGRATSASLGTPALQTSTAPTR
jgi:hypothetical protein